MGDFLQCFEDLNTSCDFKKNEFILKQFFRAKDPAKRREIEVIAPTDRISDQDDTHIKIPVELKSA